MSQFEKPARVRRPDIFIVTNEAGDPADYRVVKAYTANQAKKFATPPPPQLNARRASALDVANAYLAEKDVEDSTPMFDEIRGEVVDASLPDGDGDPDDDQD